MIHDQPITIADNTEALTDEEALTENSEASVWKFFHSTYKVLMVVLTIIWKIEIVYQLVHAKLT